jgi:hypothetical protein
MLIVADVHKIILVMKIISVENKTSDNLCEMNDCNQLYISIATKAQIAPKS